MKAKPGRKSAAQLAVVTHLPRVQERLSPPSHLSALAQHAWHQLVASRPAEFFDEAAGPLLETLAVATAEHRRLAAAMGTLDPMEDTERLAKLTRMADAHALRIGAAATKLRLTNQSRYDAQAANTASRSRGTSADRIRANYGRTQ